MRSIHLFRRDLRLDDNSALAWCAGKGTEVIPAYIVSSKESAKAWSGGKRQSVLCRELQRIDNELASRGGRLIVLHGDPVQELQKLAKQSGAATVTMNRDYDPYSKALEARLTESLGNEGIEVRTFLDRVLHESHEVHNKAGKPFVVFSPFFGIWKGLPKTPECDSSGVKYQIVRDLTYQPIPDPSEWGMAWENVQLEPAVKTLNDFVSRIKSYSEARNHPAMRTSHLSAHLRFGTISPRKVYNTVLDSQHSPEAHQFVRQLAWREFFIHLLDRDPLVLEREWAANFRGMKWDTPGENFERWKSGTTGFPIVDAAMRELRETGLMHNRARMVVSMFLTKDLHLDWRIGEQYFMQQLVDGEIAANNGGWQWSAGTGADAAPYFRVQNPWLQTKRFDRNADYIKKWVPELCDVEPRLLWNPPTEGTRFSADYPMPIVNHATEKEIAIARFKQHLGKT